MTALTVDVPVECAWCRRVTVRQVNVRDAAAVRYCGAECKRRREQYDYRTRREVQRLLNAGTALTRCVGCQGAPAYTLGGQLAVCETCRALIERHCLRKRNHPRDVAAGETGPGGVALWTYGCMVCRGWHHTSQGRLGPTRQAGVAQATGVVRLAHHLGLNLRDPRQWARSVEAGEHRGEPSAAAAPAGD